MTRMKKSKLNTIVIHHLLVSNYIKASKAGKQASKAGQDYKHIRVLT